MHERANKRRKVDSKSTAQPDSVPGFAKWDIEQDYEKRARKPGKKNEKESNKLPVKSEQSGKWEQDTSRPDEDSDSAQGSDEDDEGDSAVADLQTTQTESVVQRSRLPPKEEIRQAQEELARIASLLHENPEEHIGLLTSLSQLGKSPNTTVQKLALGTQYAIYKDIIPGYRIRSLTKEDAAAKLSKDVRQLRNFEQGLVHGYREYVQTLSRLAEPGKKAADASLASIAIACASNLLTAVPHFNFRTELITILVKKLSTRAQDGDSAKALAALEQLFRSDEEGHAALEAVIQTTKMMKSKAYHVHSNVLNSFLHLRLLSEFVHKASTTQIEKGEGEDSGQHSKKPQPKKKDRQFRTKRTRKLLRENASIAAEMREADAVVSHEERDKNQAEMLKAVFVTYFRILKARRDLPRGRAGDLLPAVLEGLARYAHLINWEFFGDLVEVLREVITESEAGPLEQTTEGVEAEETSLDARGQRNATRESLLCVITAFALLQGQQDVAKSAHTLNLDLNFFTNTLYRSLLPLSLDADIEGNLISAVRTSSNKSPPIPTEADDNNGPHPVPTTTTALPTTTHLLLRTLQAALNHKASPTSTVLATFTKTLLTASLHLPHQSSRAVLALLHQVLKSQGSRSGVEALWRTEERRAEGVWDPLSGGVEGGNVWASTVWEGEVLGRHFDPKVRELVGRGKGGILGVVGGGV